MRSACSTTRAQARPRRSHVPRPTSGMRAPFASTTSTILALAPHPLEEFISLGRDVAQAIGASSYIRIIPSKIIAIARAHLLVLMEVEAEFGEIGACAEPFWHWRSWHSGLSMR